MNKSYQWQSEYEKSKNSEEFLHYLWYYCGITMVILREVLTLNKEDFNVLNIQQQVDLVNSYLIKGQSMIDIFKRECIIESNESSVRKKFARNGFKYNREKKQYIQINEIQNEHSKKDIIKSHYPKSSIAVIPLKNNLQNTSQVLPSKE